MWCWAWLGAERCGAGGAGGGAIGRLGGLDPDVQGIFGVFPAGRLLRPFRRQLQETGSGVLTVAARLAVLQDAPEVLGNSQNRFHQ